MREILKGTALLVSTLALGSSFLRAEDSIRLQENFPEGYQYHVSCQVNIGRQLVGARGKREATSKQLPIKGGSVIDYDERILTANKTGQEKTLRIYRKVDFQRTVGDRPQEATIRPEVRRMVVLRLNQVEVPFSPDGPLLWGELAWFGPTVHSSAGRLAAGRLGARPGDRCRQPTPRSKN